MWLYPLMGDVMKFKFSAEETFKCFEGSTLNVRYAVGRLNITATETDVLTGRSREPSYLTLKKDELPRLIEWLQNLQMHMNLE